MPEPQRTSSAPVLYLRRYWPVILAIVALGLIGLPIVRSREARPIDQAVITSSQLIEQALLNPAIFNPQNAQDAEPLKALAAQIESVHERLVTTRVLLNGKKLDAARQYTDYLSRLSEQLAAVAESRQTATETFSRWQSGLNALKSSSLASRSQQTAHFNTLSAQARVATEAAFQNCVVLMTLLRQYGFEQAQVLSAFRTQGTDVARAIGALKPSAEQAVWQAHDLRKLLNPAARAPSL